MAFPFGGSQRQDGRANFQEEEVCRWWHLQSWTERVSHLGAGWRWALWSWGPSHTNQDRNHYLGHQDTECTWWEGPADPGVDCCGSEEVWLLWRQCGALHWKGSHKRTVCHCPGRISVLNAPWRPCCAEGLLWCAAVHHGEWGQRLRGRGIWETSRTEG